jgi:hypothetical protein
MTSYRKRTYRECICRTGLVSFNVTVRETDLQIWATRHLETVATRAVLQHREYIESHIRLYPEFLTTLVPIYHQGPAPRIIANMLEASIQAQVGPMAAVAGAMAEQVGRVLLKHSNDVIVENGGDIFLNIAQPATIAIFAGKSPLSMKLGLQFKENSGPFAVCTSSGTIGHSLSQGNADAVCTISSSCALADAAATAIGNRVQRTSDIQNAITYGKTIQGLSGIIVIIQDKIGLWGNITVVPLKQPVSKNEFTRVKRVI